MLSSHNAEVPSFSRWDVNVTWTSSVSLEAGWQGAFDDQRLTDIHSLLKTQLGTTIARDGGSEIRRFPMKNPEGVDSQVYIKKYFTASRKKFWRGLFRGTFFGRSKASREFTNLRFLRAHGMDAPRPVAFGEERIFGRLLNCFLITEEVPGSNDLDQYLVNILPTGSVDAKTTRQQFIANLAKTTNRMHRLGFVHRDFFWRNILISNLKLDRFYIFDAPKGRKWPRWLIGHKTEADLATLDSAAPVVFRRTERLRFYMSYQNVERLSSKDKKIIRRILREADPQRALQLRRLEGLASG
jgi:tRNA A-37 threonylcarbamoyl transferase component Bud32